MFCKHLFLRRYDLYSVRASARVKHLKARHTSQQIRQVSSSPYSEHTVQRAVLCVDPKRRKSTTRELNKK